MHGRHGHYFHGNLLIGPSSFSIFLFFSREARLLYYHGNRRTKHKNSFLLFCYTSNHLLSHRFFFDILYEFIKYHHNYIFSDHRYPHQLYLVSLFSSFVVKYPCTSQDEDLIVLYVVQV